MLIIAKGGKRMDAQTNWTELLEKTLYHGLFRVGRAVLDGTFHKREKETDKETL